LESPLVWFHFRLSDVIPGLRILGRPGAGVESSGLLNRFNHFRKFHKIKKILLPAKDLHHFSSQLISSDFTQFDGAVVTK
jgi:hypothetical protein